MVPELASRVAWVTSKNGGKPPSRVRVSPAVMRALEVDLKNYGLYDPDMVCANKIMGVELVEDHTVFFATVEFS